MTGFGRGVAEQQSVRATVDIRTVNHRFLDLKLRGAQLSPSVEEAVSQKIRATIERGSVAVSVHIARAEAAPSTSRIDTTAAAAAHAELDGLAKKLGIAGPDLALVLAQPGVLIGADRETDDAAVGLAVGKALEAALHQLEQMRTIEGVALAAELAKRMTELSGLRTRVAELAANLPQQLVKRLQERLAKLLGDTTLEPARLAQEVALLADRADVTEELVRLASHLDQAGALIAGTAAAGRRLDFLVQEIGRELNTIGSKSALTEITSAVVDAKAVLEKVREQIQNVE
jgi:uncharacterized protein (TIGR00255 family)